MRQSQENEQGIEALYGRKGGGPWGAEIGQRAGDAGGWC